MIIMPVMPEQILFRLRRFFLRTRRFLKRRKKREKKEGRREDRGGRGKGENKKCTAVVAALTGVLPPCPTPAMLRRRFR